VIGGHPSESKIVRRPTTKHVVATLSEVGLVIGECVVGRRAPPCARLRVGELGEHAFWRCLINPLEYDRGVVQFLFHPFTITAAREVSQTPQALIFALRLQYGFLLAPMVD
jgi:hypothetical protein